jgi:starvation-inducible DNA-binding protein
MFDDFAEGLEDYVDVIAERATALGGYATGTVRMAASASALPEYPTDVIKDLDHVRALVERYSALGKTSRAAIDLADKAGDKDTADLFTAVSRDLDKWLWFLEAHLQA